MARRKVVVLGGGLAGMAAAYALAESGGSEVVIVERGPTLGGLAGTFERDGHFYPLAYHHILHRDRTLLHFLELIGARDRLRWRKVRMLFRVGGELLNLANPVDFLRFPMSLVDKGRFAVLMARSYLKSDWSDWHDRSAHELIEDWAGAGVREALFEPLSHLKFGRPARELSGAWLGARLHFGEGSSPLGYIPGDNWTRILCDGVTGLLADVGVEVRLETSVAKLHGDGGRVTSVELASGESLAADVVVSTVPTETYLDLVHDETPEVNAIRYTAVISAIVTTRQRIEPDFYWMNMLARDLTACGLFRLESLNPTIGRAGESCLNFVTHVPSRHDEFFSRTADELLAGYADDFRRIFGFELEPEWTRVAKLPLYSPVFLRGYANPPVQSVTWSNLFFAGNFMTFPSIASTGTALSSGLVAAKQILGSGSPSTGGWRDFAE